MAVDAFGSQTIQGKLHVQEDFENDFKPLIRFAFNYVPSSNPLKGFKKKSDKFCNS
jgi:hypothetical protein